MERNTNSINTAGVVSSNLICWGCLWLFWHSSQLLINVRLVATMASSFLKAMLERDAAPLPLAKSEAVDLKEHNCLGQSFETMGCARQTITEYHWDQSTEDNYKSQEGKRICGRYEVIRRRLDYSYHSTYSVPRQKVQDSVIDFILSRTCCSSNNNGRKTPSPVCDSDGHWIIFTAGVMGAGKTFSVRRLHQQGRFPLEAFINVDSDEFRGLIPEFDSYVKKCPERAGELTQKETGMMVEIATEAALERGHNVLVDGSLSDSTWYLQYFAKLRLRFPRLRIGVIYVTAPIETILERETQRAKTTGRVVPKHVLLDSFDCVPKSIQKLRPNLDFFLEIENSAESRLQGNHPSCRSFWKQHFTTTGTVSKSIAS